MQRDDINPQPGDVWVGRDLKTRIIDYTNPIRWHTPGFGKMHRCSISTFRDWVGATGYLSKRLPKEAPDAH